MTHSPSNPIVDSAAIRAELGSNDLPPNLGGSHALYCVYFGALAQIHGGSELHS